jgi:hypothetical protein
MRYMTLPHAAVYVQYASLSSCFLKNRCYTLYSCIRVLQRCACDQLYDWHIHLPQE